MSILKGKTALITGGTSGIGKATVLALAKAGVNVVLTGRRQAEGDGVAREAAAMGVKAQFVQGDVTDEAHIQTAVDAAVKLGGRLDMAFNNAGIELMGAPLAESTVEQYRRVFDINVLGVALAMKHEMRAMAKQGGSIVNNASTAGTIGLPGAGIYSASKHAVIGLTKTAALEGAKSKIRVNSLSPAGTQTDMLERFIDTAGADSAKMKEQFAAAHPLGRLGTSEEMAAAALFLLGDESSFVTGHDLRVDGGYSAQ